MEKISLGKSGMMASEVALGCMRLWKLEAQDAAKALRTAYDNGINFFDHADIYGKGQSEIAFAKAFKAAGLLRHQVLIQSKCAIRKGFYDFSTAYIIASVEDILKRLETDYLDLLVLHRPDALMQPEAVAEAFNQLQNSGKVRRFGVSNHSAMQMQLLESCLSQRLEVNQLQFSPAHTGMVDAGINVNMKTAHSVDHDNQLLDYCRLKGITVQAWSPFQYGMIEGPFFDNPDFAPLTAAIREIAAQKGLTDSAVATAWILRHPARMQVIVGTMNPERIAAICKASHHTLTHEEWYEIYRAAGNPIP